MHFNKENIVHQTRLFFKKGYRRAYHFQLNILFDNKELLTRIKYYQVNSNIIGSTVITLGDAELLFYLIICRLMYKPKVKMYFENPEERSHACQNKWYRCGDYLEMVEMHILFIIF